MVSCGVKGGVDGGVDAVNNQAHQVDDRGEKKSACILPFSDILKQLIHGLRRERVFQKGPNHDRHGAVLANRSKTSLSSIRSPPCEVGNSLESDSLAHLYAHLQTRYLPDLSGLHMQALGIGHCTRPERTAWPWLLVIEPAYWESQPAARDPCSARPCAVVLASVFPQARLARVRRVTLECLP